MLAIEEVAEATALEIAKESRLLEVGSAVLAVIVSLAALVALVTEAAESRVDELTSEKLLEVEEEEASAVSLVMELATEEVFSATWSLIDDVAEDHLLKREKVVGSTSELAVAVAVSLADLPPNQL